jgi:hypothetical protein
MILFPIPPAFYNSLVDVEGASSETVAAVGDEAEDADEDEGDEDEDPGGQPGTLAQR